MIEYALLVMLGFCTAGLLALLIAPTIWRRAVRLTTKRLDATLPMSLSDIEADKDLLRASYAVQIRRLEAGLNKARDKSASQLVEISKLQMVIGEFREKVSTLDKQLEERSNAANVFERTIKKRFPEMEGALTAAKAALDERSYEITDLGNQIRRKEEALSLIQRSSTLQQQEIRKLRETLEGGAADKTGRFKKRPSQWSLEEFRSEYDRLNLELSKMREQLALAQERESGQVAVLRGELQNLAEKIMTAVAAQEKHIAEQRAAAAAEAAKAAAAARNQDPSPNRRAPAERPQTTPQPWRAEREPLRAETSKAEAPKVQEPVRPAPHRPAPRPATPAGRPDPEQASASRPSEPAKRPSITSEASPVGTKPEAASLKSLLNRATAAAPMEPAAKETVAAPAAPAAPPAQAQAQVQTVEAAVKEAGSVAAVRAGIAPGESAPVEQAATPKASEPNLDRMLREIFEGRSPAVSTPEAAPAAAAETPSVAAEPKAAAAAPEPKPATKDTTDDEDVATADADKKQSLLERLRVV